MTGCAIARLTRDTYVAWRRRRHAGEAGSQAPRRIASPSEVRE
jgi:hypothetical protein